MLDLLRSLEWCATAGPLGEDWSVCPECRSPEHNGKHSPACRLDRAIRELASEPTVDEMAREMGLWRCSGCSMSWNSKGEPVIDVAALYREHKARQVDATIAGKRVGPWLTPPAPKVYEASGPPTDPSALAAWMYARVVPGQTVMETVLRTSKYVIVTDNTGRAKRTIGRTTLVYGRIYFATDATGEFLGYPIETITRLLNPDGTVLWEAP